MMIWNLYVKLRLSGRKILFNQNILVSVVLPVFNAQEYLREAIQSILDQTFTNFEFIIIDDGSMDNSLLIIKEFMKIDKRIILISRENKGIVYTLNEGISIAKAKYIARMDADDISIPNRLEKQIELMENRSLDVCGCHYFVMDEQMNLNGLNLTPLSHEICVISLAFKVPFAHPSVMIKKEFLMRHGLLYGQSEYKIAEDFDLWLRMYEKGAKFGNVNDVLFKYRVLETSLSKIKHKGIIKDTKKMVDIFFNNHKAGLVTYLETLSDKLNDEEKSLIVRLVFKLLVKNFNVSSLKYLKNINKKIIVCSILSEIING